MLMYEKNGKLNLDFINGSIPAETPDVSMYKTGNDVHCFIGKNDIGEDNTKTMVDFVITKMPTAEQTYTNGDTLNFTGMKVRIKWDDGTKENLTWGSDHLGIEDDTAINTGDSPITVDIPIGYIPNPGVSTLDDWIWSDDFTTTGAHVVTITVNPE